MSNITRSEAIKTLKEHLSHWERLLQEHICEEQEGIDTISSLKLAIASLETDEAYQLEYEQPEFCANCIDRDYLIKDLYCKAHGETNINIHWLEGYIKELPSVLPKVDESELHKVAKEELKALVKESMKCTDCISRKKAIISITACDGKSAQIEALEKLPSVYPENTVSLSAYKQVAWERDIAIEQLKELGYEFGEKIEASVLPKAYNSVLEDIKAELNELKSHYMPSSGVEWGMKIACEIIDKHMESEDNK